MRHRGRLFGGAGKTVTDAVHTERASGFAVDHLSWLQFMRAMAVELAEYLQVEEEWGNLGAGWLSLPIVLVVGPTFKVSRLIARNAFRGWAGHSERRHLATAVFQWILLTCGKSCWRYPQAETDEGRIENLDPELQVRNHIGEFTGKSVTGYAVHAAQT